VTILVWQILSGKRENSVLKERGKVTTGNVISFKGISRFRHSVNYIFLVGSKSYQEEDEITDLDYKYFGLFRGKTFPVIYDPENPRINRILLTKSDFKQFKLLIPDTLQSLVNKTE
jgi:hypothetical protein